MIRIHLILGLVFVGACGNDARTTGTTGTTASSAATASSFPATAASSPAPASSAATNDCVRHGLTLGGQGTHADPCKFSGEIIGARFTGRMNEAVDGTDGAVIAFTNPWAESVASLTVELFYYDKDGKQLSVAVGAQTKKSIVLADVRANLPGNATTNLVLGPGPAGVPLDTDTIEARILSFALGFNGEYVSVDPNQEDRARKGGPSAGTGVPECETYIELATKCALKRGVASYQRLVSANKWSYRSSPNPKELPKKCAHETAQLDAVCR